MNKASSGAKTRVIDKSVSAAKTDVKRHPLDGLFFHLRNQDGSIEIQGMVIGVDGNRVVVQTFSWLSGSDDRVLVWDKDLMYSGRCDLYPSSDLMVRAYENEVSRKS